MGMPNIFIGAMKTTQQLLPELRYQNRTKSRVNRGQTKSSRTVTVASLLETIQPVPEQTVLLGRCRDGLPFLLELGNPEMGAVLVGCDAGSGKTHQVQVMVDSAIRANSPRAFQIAILTLNPEEWAGLARENTQQKYLQGLYAWYDDRAEGLIENLVELAEARRDGARSGTQVLLVLDDLTALEDLSREAQVNLRWLLEYGPQSGVWVVATINAAQADDFRYWVDTFRTRIIGRVASNTQATLLAMRMDARAGDLNAGEFRVWNGESWLAYDLPLLGDWHTLEV